MKSVVKNLTAYVHARARLPIPRALCLLLLIFPLTLTFITPTPAAEIPAELKNVLSHRGNAFRQLLDKLRAEPI